MNSVYLINTWNLLGVPKMGLVAFSVFQLWSHPMRIS